MSPNSKEVAFEYLEKVLKPKTAYTEDALDENNLVIKQEYESYVVNKFMMVTIKLIGDVIVCDDKSSVSVIDPKTMQKIGTVTLPNENCYLYSAYYHGLSKRIYLAFDNKKILSIDSSSYKTIGTLTLPGSALYFT
jgi:DNA-binding beta-propeller fold protein YncE